jgi:hypothetical protein
VIDSDFKPFEGMWLSSPSGSVACAKVVNGELLIPYALAGERSLAGHFYNCRLVGKTLFGRFERFESGDSGVFLLNAGENFTLKGWHWTDESLPDTVRHDVTRATDSLRGKVRTVWIRMPKAKTPSWAAQYFLEWPPNAPKHH